MAEFSTVARPYAKALFAIARASGELSAWSDALHAAAAVVSDAVAKEYLARPSLGAQERAAFLASVLERSAVGGVFRSLEGRNLLGIVSENGRLAALPEIAAQYDKLKAAAENRVTVKFRSASPVDAAQIDRIAAALQRRLGRKVEIETEIDPALVGGAVVRADDKVIDGSVRSRLERLAGSLTG
ncbi:MAG TPA: F0F1 ATP synthase subunit delta [Gammaproteobacteria bacterium]|nr:F0F1 ATP synthase subunit delta [Gammaproteobacteria bacterium]